MPSHIPLIYRVVFTWICPVFSVMGFATHIANHADNIRLYSPSAVSPRGETVHVLDNMAAFFAMLFVIEGILLRVRAHDAAVWRWVQAGGVLLDITMTTAAVKALTAEGRLQDVGSWRGDDWRLVAGNAGMGLIRLASALGWGIREKTKTN